MFRVLELITLDLLCFHSNAVPRYLEQTIRDAWAKQVFQLIQQGPSYIFDNLDSVPFADAKLQEKAMPDACRHRLMPRYEGQLLNCQSCVLKQLFKAFRYGKVLNLC
jgi:hypothetical protein